MNDNKHVPKTLDGMTKVITNPNFRVNIIKNKTSGNNKLKLKDQDAF